MIVRARLGWAPGVNAARRLGLPQTRCSHSRILLEKPLKYRTQLRSRCHQVPSAHRG